MGPAEAQHAVESAGVIATLGLDWKLFLAQLVNFGVILLIVWRFVYRPLIKVMDERSGRIERGLKDADEAEKLKNQTIEEHKNLLIQARRQAKEILETADIEVKKRQEESLNRTRLEVERVVTDGKLRLRDEQERLMKEAREQVGDLVVRATERILKEKITAEVDLDMVKRAVEVVQKDF